MHWPENGFRRELFVALEGSKMVVRRSNAPQNKVAYDSQGCRMFFDKITTEKITIYTTGIDNMMQREIPMEQLFTVFGKSAIVKAEFIAEENFCRLSVLVDASYLNYTDGCKIITYGDIKRIIESYPTGECVDAVLCASYEDALTLAPYIYDWKNLSLFTRIFRALLFGLLLTVAIYAVRDTAMKDYAFLVFMLLKDSIWPLVTGLFL